MKSSDGHSTTHERTEAAGSHFRGIAASESRYWQTAPPYLLLHRLSVNAMTDYMCDHSHREYGSRLELPWLRELNTPLYSVISASYSPACSVFHTTMRPTQPCSEFLKTFPSAFRSTDQNFLLAQALTVTDFIPINGYYSERCLVFLLCAYVDLRCYLASYVSALACFQFT